MMPIRTNNGTSGNDGDDEKKWELRPGGMVVQKCIRVPPPPTIRVRVKYESIYHDIYISCQATFGDLKKMLCGPTGLHHEDQKLFYKRKERGSTIFLDKVGVKNKSKLHLQKDPISEQKRYMEMRRKTKMEMSAKLISEIRLAIDKLAVKVSALENVIAKADIVEEKDVDILIELLMNQFLQLDNVAVDGDFKLQRNLQERRVQKYVETLDMLKLKIKKRTKEGSASSLGLPLSHGSVSSAVPGGGNPFGHSLIDLPELESKSSSHPNLTPTMVVATQWETFDSTMLSGTSTSQTVYPTTKPTVTWDLL